jgi:hypothetical protein
MFAVNVSYYNRQGSHRSGAFVSDLLLLSVSYRFAQLKKEEERTPSSVTDQREEKTKCGTSAAVESVLDFARIEEDRASSCVWILKKLG